MTAFVPLINSNLKVSIVLIVLSGFLDERGSAQPVRGPSSAGTVKLLNNERKETMSKLETKCLHAGYESAEATTHSHAVPVYRTASYRFDSTEHAANLFTLKELGNIYTRLMNPTQDLEEYGYELWIRIDPDTELGGEIVTKDFPGGLYAVARCSLYGDPRGNVLEIWKQLWDWVQSSKYSWRNTHELEKPVDARVPERDLVLDLYLPIEW